MPATPGVTDISPNVENYYVGAGICKWKGEDDSTYRDVGNVSEFAFTSTVTRLKHYSSRTGTRFKDRDVVTQLDASVAIKMDEITAANLALAVLGTASGSSPIMIEVLTQANKKGAFRLIGTNDIGAKIQIDLPSCLITPSGAIGLINAGTWGELSLTAEVNGDINTGSFGRYAWNTDGVELTDLGGA
jgi:hypothetical protein